MKKRENYKIMKNGLLTISILLAFTFASAQQFPLFTNYVLNDFGFNPAIAGSTDYLDLRMTYRTQWIGIEDAPQTQILSAQSALRLLPIGIGGYVYNDVAGQIKRTGVSGAISYGINLGNGKLNLGLSGGFFNFRLNENHLVETAIDPILGNAITGRWTPELSLGLFYQSQNGVFFGISAPQIFKQKINFHTEQSDFTTNIIPHYYAMAGYRLNVNEQISLEPSVLLKVTTAVPLQIDASLKAIFKQRLWVAGSYRSQDAASIMIGYDIHEKMGLAYAYDFTLSGLQEGSKGSHEFSLIFRLGKKDSDGDGIPDKLDKCPEEPGTESNEGCRRANCRQ